MMMISMTLTKTKHVSGDRNVIIVKFFKIPLAGTVPKLVQAIRQKQDLGVAISFIVTLQACSMHAHTHTHTHTGTVLLRNVDSHIPDYMMSKLKRPEIQLQRSANLKISQAIQNQTIFPCSSLHSASVVTFSGRVWLRLPCSHFPLISFRDTAF